MARVACFLFLLLSTCAPPCDATRRLERATLNNWEGASVGADAGSTQAWGFWCPEGLRSNTTEKVCYYDGAILDEEGRYPMSESAFNAIGQLPLILDSPEHGGTFLLEQQFASELVAALEHRTVLDRLGEDLMEIEMRRNETLAENVQEFFNQLHEFGHNHKPVEFLIVHLGIHAGFEMIIHGVEAALHCGLAASSTAIAEGAIIGIPVIGWVLLPIMASIDAFMAYRHYKHKTHHAKHFAKQLAWKADCVAKRVGIEKDNADDAGNLLKATVDDVCGPYAATLMAKQIQRANVRMLELMDAIAEMGRCLWPHGPRAWAKTNCAEAVHTPLRALGGAPGLMYLAISTANAYAHNVNDVLKIPAYNNVFKAVFNINTPKSRTMLQTLEIMKTHDLANKAMGCMSMLATHRAFERIFKRLTVAMKVWSRTYARDTVHRDFRMLAHSYPCKRVFHKLADNSSWQEATCKDEEFSEGHGVREHPISERDPCLEDRSMSHNEDLGFSLWPEIDEEPNEEAPTEE